MKFKITKFTHSCLLVESNSRVALFDPGVMSTPSLNLDDISQLDDVFITQVKAINLALELKPQHILPIHDWHWHDQARKSSYDRMEQIFSEQGITFHKLVDGQSVDIEV